MFSETAKSNEQFSAGLVAATKSDDRAAGGGVFHFQCFDKDGNLKWEEQSHNLVVNQGLQDMNSKYFTGSGYTAAWYLGLISGTGPTISGGDTFSLSEAGKP